MEAMWVRFYLRTLEEFYNREVLQRFLTDLVSWGYHLQDLSEPLIAQITPEITAGITPTLQRTLNTYSTQHEKSLKIQATDITTSDLEFLIMLYPASGYLLLIINQEQFFSDETERESYQYWLELLAKMYHSLHPYYVNEYFHEGANVDRNLVMNKKINFLYETNIFGPELVAHIGRERLLNAPAWKTEELADGAILVIPIEHFATHEAPTLAEIAQTLDMDSPAPDKDEGNNDE